MIVNISKALVIIPHQDDEINLMGGLIPLLFNEGVELHFVYLTNGDAICDGEVRIREAINALKVLGVEKQNIHFLGYPDSNNSVDNCLYKRVNILNCRSRQKTYGGADVSDWAFESFGQHSDYTYLNLKKDLKDCILKIHPDVIFATDFDSHLDHRICSLVFEEIMSEILMDTNIQYYPFVYKGFAYSTAFTSVKDYYLLNFRDTQKPNVVSLAKNTKSELDNPLYQWNERIQFPVDEKSVGSFLYSNVLYKALKKHISQCISKQSTSIINGDKPFWARPTCNLMYQAEVWASSGSVENLLDFRMFDVKNICERVQPLEFEYIGWQPDNNDDERVLNIQFAQSVSVKNLNLYVHTYNHQTKPVCNMEINENVALKIEDFANYGSKYVYTFKEEINVERIKIRVLSEETKLLYIEVLPDYIPPMTFAKLKINDNFAYNHYLDKNQEKCDYEIYSYGIDVKNLEVHCDDSGVIISNFSCVIPKSIDKVQLTIRNRYTKLVYDKVSVIRLKRCDRLLRYIKVVLDKIYVDFIHRVQKIKRHNLKRKNKC